MPCLPLGSLSKPLAAEMMTGRPANDFGDELGAVADGDDRHRLGELRKGEAGGCRGAGTEEITA